MGLIIPGGLYNGTIRALQQLGLADTFGNSRIPLQVLNVVYPLVPDELVRVCANKRAVLMVEEGQPNYIEESLQAILRRAQSDTRLYGKDIFPMAGEYTGEVLTKSLAEFIKQAAPAALAEQGAAEVSEAAAPLAQLKPQAVEALGVPVPARPPGFCIGCPERPVFAALKLMQKELGNVHVSADIGCHTSAPCPLSTRAAPCWATDWAWPAHRASAP